MQKRKSVKQKKSEHLGQRTTISTAGLLPFWLVPLLLRALHLRRHSLPSSASNISLLWTNIFWLWLCYHLKRLHGCNDQRFFIVQSVMSNVSQSDVSPGNTKKKGEANTWSLGAGRSTWMQGGSARGALLLGAPQGPQQPQPRAASLETVQFHLS